MDKKLLKLAFEKYYLNGLVESVKVSIKNKEITIDFIPTDNKSLIGKILINNIELPDADIAIYSTTQFLKLLKIMDETININLYKEQGIFTKILLEDNNYDLEYYLADINIISKVPKIKEPEKPSILIPINDEFSKKYLVAKKALGDIKKVKIKIKKDKINFELGDSDFSNKIKFFISLPQEVTEEINIPFSSDIIAEILSSNSTSESGELSIYHEGLLKFTFKEKSIVSSYFLVKLEE